MLALVLVGIHVAVLELTLWMAWDPSIILLPPLFSWEKPKSRLAGFAQASEQLLAMLVHWHARLNQHDCVMSGQGLGYLFWGLCVGSSCRRYWS